MTKNLKIVTWNINSVRIRLNHIKRFIEAENPDILCLQETKVQDKDFPLEEIKSLGFDYVIFRGEKSYNGVSIFSKIPLKDATKLNILDSEETRHISAILPNDIELHNFYIPAGGDEPDININPKFKFKLEFVEYLNKWFSKNRTKDDKIVILGDFNIAPLENDVWSHKQLRNVVSHTEIEIKLLNEFKSSLNWIDIGRHFTPESEKLYSWWSYRNRDWQKSNRGRRLDHIWATPALELNLNSHKVFNDARNWEKPSDHAPVIVEFKNI